MLKYLLLISLYFILSISGRAYASDADAACVVKKDAGGGVTEFSIHKDHLGKFLSAGFESFACPTDLSGGKKWGQKFCTKMQSAPARATAKMTEVFGISPQEICSAVQALT